MCYYKIDNFYFVLYVGKYFVNLALLKHTEPFYMTKWDENHLKNLDILQYEIIMDTYFTIYLYISV